jgi:chemotaxis family two-component system response regulator Rcp1
LSPNISAVRRVLVVEDNPADVYLIRSALTEHSIDAQVDVISDGESARSTTAEFQSGKQAWPDIVLLDINLPRIDGLELLHRMAQAPCPIVVMSSSQSPADRQQALDHGAACYFWKPTDLDGFLHLGQIVAELLKEKGHNAQSNAS